MPPERNKRAKLYVASSWKNGLYENLCSHLFIEGYEILDWREGGGFGWHQVTEIPKQTWSGEYYRDFVLASDRAIAGFKNDAHLMDKADGCVLLLPCGRSAHLEAGVFVGRQKPLHIFIPQFEEPELMYKFATSITFNIADLIRQLDKSFPRQSGCPSCGHAHPPGGVCV